jgi:hypothetical protein
MTPAWVTVAVALVAVFGALGGNWITNQLAVRSSRARERQAAYLNLLGASECLAGRMAAASGERTALYAAGQTLQSIQKLVLVMILVAILGRHRLETARLLADAVPLPHESDGATTTSELLQRQEELVRAQAHVRLVGSDDAIDAADRLLDASKTLVVFLENHAWPRRGTEKEEKLRTLRGIFKNAHEAFARVATAEQRGRWRPFCRSRLSCTAR